MRLNLVFELQKERTKRVSLCQRNDFLARVDRLSQTMSVSLLSVMEGVFWTYAGTPMTSSVGCAAV